jgi:hypothetical protein
MGGLNNFLLRKFTQKPSRKEVTSKFRFCMPRWHINNKSFTLSSGDPLKRPCHFDMMFSMNKRRPNIVNEDHEVILGLIKCDTPLSLNNEGANLLLDWRG